MTENELQWTLLLVVLCHCNTPASYSQAAMVHTYPGLPPVARKLGTPEDAAMPTNHQEVSSNRNCMKLSKMTRRAEFFELEGA